jgi:hypothetical protein
MDISEKQTAGHLPELDQHRHRLITQYLERGVDESVVLERLTLICQRFAAARIRSYLPVLVERALRAELEAA